MFYFISIVSGIAAALYYNRIEIISKSVDFYIDHIKYKISSRELIDSNENKNKNINNYNVVRLPDSINLINNHFILNYENKTIIYVAGQNKTFNLLPYESNLEILTYDDKEDIMQTNDECNTIIQRFIDYSGDLVNIPAISLLKELYPTIFNNVSKLIITNANYEEAIIT